METILDTIAEHNRALVEEAKKGLPMKRLQEMALASPLPKASFEENLRKPGMSFICEVKKASPSKGVIAEHFPYLQIAREYAAAGASAISVLTEPKWFLGSLDYLKEIASEVDTPCLRKDFIVDPYQIYEARCAGASAVLLICSILDQNTLKEYLKLTEELGTSALVEAHDEAEAQMAVEAGAKIIGVNNRNLKDFTVDPTNCLRLRSCIPNEILFVAESGIKTAEDIRVLEQNHVDAVLIGESMMRSEDKSAFLAELKG